LNLNCYTAEVTSKGWF